MIVIIKQRLKKGNGVMIFGSALMILVLTIVILFIQSFLLRQKALDTQYAVDSIADGTAVYLVNEGGDYDDANKRAKELLKIINRKMDTDLKDVTVDKKALEEDDTVKVRARRKIKYRSSLSSDASVFFTRKASTTILTGFHGGILQWAVQTAEDDRIGYNQAARCLNPDVDCSSFVYYSLINGGGFTHAQLDGPYPFTTATMGGILLKNGFRKIPYNPSILQEGDILWKSGHTELYLGNNQSIGAHGSENGGKYGRGGDQTGGEVSAVPLRNKWSYIYRLGGK